MQLNVHHLCFYFRFDLKNTNVNDDNLDKMSADKIPDVVLIKKVYGEKSIRNRRRKWKLKHLNEELHETNQEKGGNNANEDYNDFLEDLEEDTDLRQNVKIYKDAKKINTMAVDTESDTGDAPQITLAEMMDDLVLDMES